MIKKILGLVLITISLTGLLTIIMYICGMALLPALISGFIFTMLIVSFIFGLDLLLEDYQ